MPNRLLSICVLSAFAFACSSRKEGVQTAVKAAAKSDKLISDQAHNQGRFGFAFEPPVVSAYSSTPGIRTDISPTVQIDQVDPATNKVIPNSTVVNYTMTTGTCCAAAQELVRLIPVNGLDDGDTDTSSYYVVRWRTDLFPNLQVYPAIYRITVKVNNWTLGFADTQLDTTRTQLKNVNTAQYTPLMDNKTLRIKFRIDTPAIDYDLDGVLDAFDNCWKVPNGPAQATVANVGNQTDTDGDGIGDACDACPDEKLNDPDHDTICAGPRFLASFTQSDNVVVQTGMTRANDNCPLVYNLSQTDTGATGIGDACRPVATATLSGSGTVSVTDPNSPLVGAGATFAAGTLPAAGTVIKLNQLQAGDIPPAVIVDTAIGPIIDVQGPAGGVYNPPVTVALPYDPAQVPDLRQLTVYHFNTIHGEYETLPIQTVDLAKHLVYVQSATLSPFFASKTAAILIQQPTGFFLQGGQQTLNTSADPFTLGGQVGLPAGATTVRVTMTQQTTGDFAFAAVSAVPAANCDPSVLSAKVLNCMAFTVSVPLTPAANTSNEWVQVRAQPLSATGAAVGNTTLGNLYVNLANFPGAPLNFAASTTATNQINLSWTDGGGGATSYTIQRSLYSGFGFATLATVPSSQTTYSDLNLGNGALYYYIVYAVNASGRSPSSAQVLGSTPLPPPTLSATAATTTSISLSWTAVSGATNYQVFRSPTAGGPYTSVASLNKNAVSTTDSGLAPGTPYFYVIQAVGKNATGAVINSVNSNEVAYSSVASAIAGLTAAPSAATIVLNWPAQANEPAITGVNIYRSATTGGPYTLLTTTAAAATTYTDAAGTGQTFFYVADPVDSGGIAANSNQVTATTIPAAITDLAAGATGNVATLTWTAQYGATGYNVYRSLTTGGPYTLVSTVGASPATDTGDSGTDYFYVVRPFNATGEASSNSNEVSVTMAPPVATGLHATEVGATIVLDWPATKGAKSGYKVSRSETTGGPYVQIGVAPFAVTPGYTDTTVVAGHTYYYTIIAFNGAGSHGSSNEATATMRPAAPTGLTAVATNQTFALNWTAPYGAVSYTVLRGLSAGGPYTVTAGSPNVTSFTDGPLDPGTTYFYVVTATNIGGTGPQSNEAKDTTVLPPPSALAATQGAAVGTIGLTWSAVPQTTSFTVQRSSDGTTFVSLAPTTTALNFTDSALLNGTKYYYRVIGSDAVATSAPSAVASAVTLLPAPTALKGTVSIFDITLTWTGTQDAVSYDVLRSLSATGPFTTIASAVAGTTYCNCGATAARTPNTTYYYQVIANTAAAVSVPSNTASATTVFPAPTGLAIANTGTTGPDRTKLAATWNVVPGATTYSIQRSLAAAGPFTEIAQPGTNGYTDSGLAFSTTYFYQVQALSPSGPSPASTVASGTTLVSPWLPGSGLTGGEVTAVIFDPASAGKTGYAAVRSGAGVFKTTDGGLNWAVSGNGLNGNTVTALAISGGKILAGTPGAGVFASTDGAGSWSASGGPSSALVSISADPKGSGTVFAATPSHVYESLDNGVTWQSTSLSPGSPLTAVIIDPNKTSTLFAASESSGLYKSTDSGATWAVAGLAAETLQGGLVIDPANSLSVWAGSAHGVQASKDGGATWALQGTLTDVHSLALTGTVLYAGTNGAGVFSSTAGAAWTATGGGGAFLGGVTSLAAAGAQLLAGSYGGQGIYYSSTSGGSWGTASTGINVPDTTALAISADASELFAVAGFQLMRSLNHGSTWQYPVTSGLTYPVVATAVAIDPTSASVVYVGANGVRRSTDAGATFASTGANFVPSSLAIPAQAHNTVYAAVYNGGVYTADFSVAAPAWKQINNGITNLRIRSVAVDPANAQNLFAGGEGGFFRSTNGGATWTSSGLAFVRSITAVGGQVFAVVGSSTASNLQKSTDGGATFTPVNFGTAAVENLVSLAVSGNTLYAVGDSSNGSIGGLYKSIDGGTTWKAIKPGLSSSRLRTLLIDPAAASSLYLASEDNGVLLSASAGE